ncbi:putative uncharacterized oxidoreductase [Trichoplax sp. H2]|uniref:NAD-dependent epimerase/dehydratase domain-containing protein n=1 Tax=Trichoplax adhaerens TaxID=10228 RepID=B3SBI3_TRIAD|nr:hypothetical protein TRIADDRAFT_32781 [Trichoplax adhaerens]EDV19858.1 hypothetical protein TRIADDRAFT_32781 [Trichoplax adhaerens]RDD40804.1 putative uncharacterized oxidoreductase [Trichoplax sp. H2]|eukprot:XP_002117600.1 hypothetical protein TRIADDRAFT_32781 [Trichoplax adhaerens]
MAQTDEGALVLVTGASGFIATHVVLQLQQQGYRVRGSVRSLTNEKKVKPLKELCPNAKFPLQLIEADLLVEETWHAAVQDCKYVMHVASPLPLGKPRNEEEELIKPAVNGTLNVLKACAKAGCVKRVVMTSTVGAIIGGMNGENGRVYNEKDWADIETTEPYCKSKTLAEKAAWEFIENCSDNEKFEFCTINPCVTVGPVLHNTPFLSMQTALKLFDGSMPVLPNFNFPLCDVRDVAAAHLKAMIVPEAVGQRHIIYNSNMWYKDISLLYVREFGPYGYKFPTMVAPKFVLWLASLFDPTLKLIIPFLNITTIFDNTRMKEVLNVPPRDISQAIIDLGYSLIERDVVKKTPGYTGRPACSKPDDNPTSL